LAWAAQGITEPNDELRSAPSAGALYPLELYFVIRDGLFHYQPQSHSLELKQREDLRERIAEAALDQVPLRVAPCTVVITAVTLRTARKYDARASRYIAMEAGHAAQNLLLEATSRGLVGVPVGAFDDARLASLLALPDGEVPLYLIAVGNPP
jgi:SagB-type dehydrogenase family enzyme